MKTFEEAKQEFIRSWIVGRTDDTHNWTMFMTADLTALLESYHAQGEQSRQVITDSEIVTILLTEMEAVTSEQIKAARIILKHLTT